MQIAPGNREQEDDKGLTVSAFLMLIKNALDNQFKQRYHWIHGEISEWKKHNINYYGELIEYNSKTHEALAKIRLNLWGGCAKKIIPKFYNTTGEHIKSGMKVMLLTSVNFHPNYGLSLNIIDLNPAFTLGDREIRKQKIIADLTKKGIVEKNKTIDIPIEFTNVAIVSSKNAAGLDDFFVEANALQKYKLCKFELYYATMQGKACPNSTSEQFRKIYKLINSGLKQYDAVVLIRGGGSQSDLDCFNYYAPAEAVCHMSIPVFIGIGHERDHTILDILATRSFGTPSKVIHYIVSTIKNGSKIAWKNFKTIHSLADNICKKNQIVLERKSHIIINLSRQITGSYHERCKNYHLLQCNYAGHQIHYHKQVIVTCATNIMQVSRFINTNCDRGIIILNFNIKTIARAIVCNYKVQLIQLKKQILQDIKGIIIHAQKNINLKYKGILSMSIKPTLKRGFVLTQSKGKYITSAKQAKQHTKLNLIYHDGKITTEIKSDKRI